MQFLLSVKRSHAPLSEARNFLGFSTHSERTRLLICLIIKRSYEEKLEQHTLVQKMEEGRALERKSQL